MFLVGLTGGIATGKSTVVATLRNLGIEVIDADVVAREVVEPGRKAWKKIRREFGEPVFHSDGTLNRKALGQIVFSEPEKRKKLNSITHPEIYKSIFSKCFRLFLRGHQFTVVDLPLLYESGKMLKFLHKVIVVRCEPSQQLERLMLRDCMQETDALARINAQMKLEEKCRLADYVVDNSRDENYARHQVESIVSELRNSNAQWKFRFIAIGTVFILGGLAALSAYEVSKLV